MFFKKTPKNEHDVKLEIIKVLHEEIIRINHTLTDKLDKSGWYLMENSTIVKELLDQRRNIQEKLFEML